MSGDIVSGRITRRSLLATGATIAALPRPALTRERSYRRIACEEAFLIPEIRQALSDLAGGVPSMRSGPIAGPFMDGLMDIGEGRIAKMTAAGIDRAVLSLTAPGVQAFSPDRAIELAKLANDRLHNAVAAHPRHYAGLASVPPQAPDAAAQELERAVRILGLNGAIINSSTNDEYLDSHRVRPIFEAAAALDVPVYIHPREPSPSMGEALIIPGFTVGWGYAVEAGTNALRLIASGIFDELPRLRIILGHMGETLPMLLDRLDNRYRWETSLRHVPRLKRLPSEYFRDNFRITTSGTNYPVAVHTGLEAVGAANVMFAADYPFEDQVEAVAGLEHCGLTSAQKRAVFEDNAVKTFKLN